MRGSGAIGVAGPIGDFAGTSRFEILGRLGVGGMGVVYRAFDRELRSSVALKLLPKLSGEAILRFKTEFQTLQDIHHPNLVALGELFVEGGRWFFTMELVGGVDFLAYVRRSASATFEEDVTHAASATAATHAGPATASRMAETIEAHSAPSGGDVRRPAIVRTRSFDEARLRSSLAELARGLAALHAAHKVHRDIKPSNILVTDEGRAVLLDFGIAIDTTSGVRRDHEIVGTLDYMSPEQARGDDVTPASDWYSVGVMLYEALTGVVPFAHTGFAIIAEKQLQDPVPVSALVPEPPDDLAALCMDLLQRAPEHRPNAQEVLRRLRAFSEPAVEVSDLPAPVFIGREPELDALEDALRAARGGTPVLACVQGVSGIGKSALVRRFVDAISAREPPVVVLSGRCYERASVPYKALDGAMDSLSHFLRRLPERDAAALLPDRASLLLTAFPVLGRVEAFASAPRPSQEIVDHHELRARVFSILREMLARLAARWPVIIGIDDLQWTDADSLSLLRELVRPPGAPPLLLVATLRASSEAEASALLDKIPGEVRRIRLEPLPVPLANELASRLLARVTGHEAVDAAAIAEEACGHPMFIDELARHARRSLGARAELRLDEVLRARVAELDTTDRRLIEVIAIAGAPVPQEVAAAAAELDFGDFTRRATLLRAANLVRTGGAHATDLVEPYHDRVREAVAVSLDAEQRRRHHANLASAMEAKGGADPASLAIHWHGAGAPELAAAYAVQAADEAANSLAFDRSARLYALALDLCPGRADARALRIRRADALANAGRGAEAADQYLAALAGAGPAEARELQRRAAEQLLRAGHIDEGMAAIEAVLRSVGIQLARSRAKVLVSLLWQRARLALRGIRFVERAERDIRPEELSRIDVTWAVATGLAIVDPIQAAEFETRTVLLALDAGEPCRVARALALETTFVDTEGPKDPSHRNELIKIAEALALRVQNPVAIAFVLAAKAQRSFNIGLYAEARGQVEEAISAFADRCTGAVWETTSMRMYLVASLFYLGRAGELARAVPRFLQEAEDRGDVLGAAMLRTGFSNSAWLVEDAPARARAEADRGIARWSSRGFHVQHYYHLLAQAQNSLYAGDGADGYRRVSTRWGALERSLLLRVQTVRMEALFLYGRCALAAAVAASSPSRRRELERHCARIAARLRAELNHHATWPFSELLLAGLAALRGEREPAAARLAAAEGSFEGLEMKLFAAAARRQRGRLIGGDEGRSLVASAEHRFAEEGIQQVACYARLLLPDFAR